MAALTLRAPFDGRVGRLFFRAGDSAEAAAPVATVMRERVERVVAYVDERWARRVSIGDHATVRPSDGLGVPLSGRVVGLGAGIREVPPRFRRVPSEVLFGREVFVQLSAPDAITLPGQAFDVTFRRSTP